MKHLIFTVTNDLSYDQRMHRICHSLALSGYQVSLVGRQLKHSPALEPKPFRQIRLKCLFNKGILFYTEYNIRLLIFLLFQKTDGVCAIDLDTILPCYVASKVKSVPRVYDAHEYFTELKEVMSRPLVYKVWTVIEKLCVPRFKNGYTVSDGITELFNKKYGHSYITIRNFPINKAVENTPIQPPYLFFGGVVNEARGFEVLIPAMKNIPYQLVIAGDGNFMTKLKALIEQHGVAEKVKLKGMVSPTQLRILAEKATLGIGLAEKEGMNQFLALPNKFLDYMHAGLPQITMDYPEYARLNDAYNIAVLIKELDPDAIAETINSTISSEKLLVHLRQNCLKAKEELNWKKEEERLILFYDRIFKGTAIRQSTS